MKFKTGKMIALQRAFDVYTYLKEHDPDAKQHGGELAVDCPYCAPEGKLKKLWVQVEDKPGKRAGHWICYYCDEGGTDVLGLIRWIEDCSLFEAIEILTTYRIEGKKVTNLRKLVEDTLFGVEKIEVNWDDSKIEPVPLPREFKKVKEPLHPYLVERGIDITKVKRYGLGICKDGYFKNRLVVPVSLHGEQLFFIARYMKKTPPAGIKKSLYPKGAKSGRVLFNYDVAKEYETVYLVEDVFSAMHLGKAAMATFGTSLSQYQLELLLKTNAEEIVIIWDRDLTAKKGKSGYEKALALAHRLSEFFRVRVVKLPDERDPDEFTRKRMLKMIARTPVLDERAAFKERILTRLGVSS